MSNEPAQQTFPSGDQENSEVQRLHVGDHVADAEGVTDSTMIVVGIPGRTAREYRFGDGQKTVADVNPEYDQFSEVIECKIPDRTDNDLGSLKEYAYPASRLELVEPIHEIEAEGDAEENRAETDNDAESIGNNEVQQ